MLNRPKNCFGKRSDKKSIKGGLGRALSNRADSVKFYKKSEQKCKNDMKSLKKHNKTIYTIANKSGSSCEMNKTKNIKAKASNKRIHYSSNSLIRNSDYSFSCDSE